MVGYGHWGTPGKMGSYPWLSPPSLLSDHHEVSIFAPCHTFLPSGFCICTSWSWTNPYKTMSQNKFLLLSIAIIGYFSPEMRKVTETPLQAQKLNPLAHPAFRSRQKQGNILLFNHWSNMNLPHFQPSHLFIKVTSSTYFLHYQPARSFPAHTLHQLYESTEKRMWQYSEIMLDMTSKSG